jgi:hypothetical protein
MHMEFWFTRVLGDLAVGLPMYVVYAVGFILALVRWQRHPRVSFLAALAIAILCLTRIVMTIAYAWLPNHLLHERALSHQATSYVYMGLGFSQNLVSAGAWILLLSAIFIGRQVPAWLLAGPVPPRPPEEGETAYREVNPR